MDKIFELEEINAGYDNKIVLKNINFVVRKNDFIGIIGPNGGGKTTLLRVIIGQLKPFNGHVKYYHNLKNDNRNIGYLPQAVQVDEKFPISVMDVLLSGLISGKQLLNRISLQDKSKAYSLLEKMNILHIKDRMIGDLSGGELQRVLLGRSIISEPILLVLDEPDTFVDNKFEQDLYNTLLDLNKKMAIIIVSHDIGTISSYIKSIACVNQTLHYHDSNIITQQQLLSYDCPVQIIAHGDVPHTVLGTHKNES